VSEAGYLHLQTSVSQVKVFDATVVTCRPTVTFLAPNTPTPISFQHGRFDYKAEELGPVYSKRKVRVHTT